MDPNQLPPIMPKMAPMMPPAMALPPVDLQPQTEQTDIDELLAQMDTPEEKTEKTMKMDEMELLRFNTMFGSDFENRRVIDWQWYVYDAYFRGNHFVKWNDATATLESVPDRGAMRFPINKIYSTIRAVRGFVTKYDPKWEVFPENKSSDAITKGRYKAKVLDSEWYQGMLKKKSKEVVFDGLKYSVGIIELGWDEDEKEVTYTNLDPFDVYFGGGKGEYVRRITKVVRRNIDELENDDKYTTKKGKLVPTDDLFASDAKKLIHNQTYGHTNQAVEEDDGVLVRETFYLTSKENSLGGKVNIATYTDGVFLRHVETTYKSLWDVFQVYHSDENPGEDYGEGWIKNLLPTQKMLDILESLTMEYHHMFAKGRYVVAKNAGAKIISNENGVILEHNAGRRPVVENAPSMAASVEQQIQRFNIYLEDLGGQHDASLGRIPTGATAGVAIEALQEGDANNLKDLRENFEIFLVGMAKATFKMYARKLLTTKVIDTDDKDGDGLPDRFAIIGEDATNKPEFIQDGPVKIPVCVIHDNEKVRVTVGSWLAYTREALEARVYKHYTAGLIDRKTALDALNYSDPDAIIEKALKEQVITQMVGAGVPEGQPQMEPGSIPAEEPSAGGAIPTPPPLG